MLYVLIEQELVQCVIQPLHKDPVTLPRSFGFFSLIHAKHFDGCQLSNAMLSATKFQASQMPLIIIYRIYAT